MFRNDKIYNDGCKYVYNDINYNIISSWEKYCILHYYINMNYYDNLHKECEYYKELLNY